MSSQRLLSIGDKLEATTKKNTPTKKFTPAKKTKSGYTPPVEGRKSMTMIMKIVKDVQREMRQRIEKDAEAFVLDHLKHALVARKKELKKAGDPYGQTTEDMLIVSLVIDSVRAFKLGLKDFHGHSDWNWMA